VIYWMIALYLLAILIANLSVFAFGQAALVVTAFVLVPFDLSTRDLLHEKWSGKKLFLKMFVLILSGSVLSFFVSFGSWKISLASCCSFLLASFLDFLVYESFRRRGFSKKIGMNTSNAVSAVVDSWMFPLIAFGGGSLYLSATQAGLKFVGGAVWTSILLRGKK